MFTTVLIFEMILHMIMSFISAKVIVLTGLPDGCGGAEVIDFFNSENCHLLSEYFTPRHGSVGGVLNNPFLTINIFRMDLSLAKIAYSKGNG